jgi:homoserine dehydrogenase
MRNKLNIGLFGFGVVGSGLYDVLNRSKLLDASISAIVVKDPNKKRTVPSSLIHFDKDVILNDSNINVVVELINDSEAAYEIVKKALTSGIHVVTANKKLIAEHFEELITLARANNVSLLYEAAVGGSIPIIRNLEEYYNNDTLSSVQGIVNGTTNYILAQSNQGVSYEVALKKAQELGFAEAEPTLDVDGFDSKYKLVLLIKHAFGVLSQPDEVYNYGIRHLKPQDVNYALEKGYRIKLFSRAEKLEDGIAGFVAPHFVGPEHSAYRVKDEFNAVIVEALFSDKQLFIGKGAGSYPTASAVLSDISALQFDYRYEYRKSDGEQAGKLISDYYLKVYVGSENEENVKNFPFTEVDEAFKSKGYNYQTGYVKFSDLQIINLNKSADLSLIVLPEPLFSEKSEQGVLLKNKLNFAEIN